MPFIIKQLIGIMLIPHALIKILDFNETVNIFLGDYIYISDILLY